MVIPWFLHEKIKKKISRKSLSPGFFFSIQVCVKIMPINFLLTKNNFVIKTFFREIQSLKIDKLNFDQNIFTM